MNGGEGLLEQGRSLFEGFHWGEKSTATVPARVSPEPRALVKLGRLEAVAYSTKKDGERATWEHEFGEEGGKKPTLAMDAETRRLHIVGGDYDVEDRGIVD